MDLPSAHFYPNKTLSHFLQILQIELTEVTEDTIDLEEDIFDGEDELLQVIHPEYLMEGAHH